MIAPVSAPVVKANLLIGLIMLNALLVADVSAGDPDAVVVSVYPVPGLLIWQFVNVAKPEEFVETGLVPQVKVPLPGFVPIANVMERPLAETGLPNVSST